jgi:Flp pilus assembly CpaF family ATPase
MGSIDRIVASLVSSDHPLNRSALSHAAKQMQPDVAPLAGPEDIDKAVDALVGLGPLESLVADDSVSDVLVNAYDDVWIERSGVLERTDISFRSAEELIALVRRVITPIGLRIDAASPAVDARLADGSRLHAIIPPAAVDGPVVAIRRFSPAVADLDMLVAHDALRQDGADLLGAAVQQRDNILIAGATGAGKTTVLNALAASVGLVDRIVTVEDAAELSISGHVIRLESHPANVEGAGEVTMRSLLRHALRLRPDRIIVGEVRGPEAPLSKPPPCHRGRGAESVRHLRRCVPQSVAGPLRGGRRPLPSARASGSPDEPLRSERAVVRPRGPTRYPARLSGLPRYVPVPSRPS